MISYQHQREKNQQEFQRNDGKLSCLCPFWCCKCIPPVESLQGEEPRLPPSTFPQRHRPKPAGGTYFLLCKCRQKFILNITILSHTYYFSAFHPRCWYFIPACLFIVVGDELRDILAWFPGWFLIVFPFYKIDCFYLYYLFVENPLKSDSCKAISFNCY